MIRIEDYEVWGIRKAVDGIRNSYSNRDKGDSSYSLLEDGSREYALGEKDLELMIRLVKEGQPCRKFLRMIHVQCDVTAPMYWWKQMDTYTIGKVQNSESTMHIHFQRNLLHLIISVLMKEGLKVKTICSSIQNSKML